MCSHGLATRARAGGMAWYMDPGERALKLTLRTPEGCEGAVSALARTPRLDITEFHIDVWGWSDGDEDPGHGRRQAAAARILRQVAFRAPLLETAALAGLTFERGAGPGSALEPLRHLLHLRRLALFPVAEDDDAWGSVRVGNMGGLPITELTLECNPNPHDVHIAPLPRGVTSFTLKGLEIRDGMDFLDRALPRGLQSLTYEDVTCALFADENYVPNYARLKDLASLRVIDSTIDPDNLPVTLTSLHVQGRHQTLFGLGDYRIGHLTRLQDLVFSRVLCDDDGHDDDEGFFDGSQLRHLTGLTRLALDTIDPVADAGALETLTGLVDLTLNVVLPDLTAPPPLPDAPLTSLRLSLWDAAGIPLLPLRLGRPGVPDLARYPALSSLTLHCVALDAPAVSYLRDLPALKTLSLEACQVADADRHRLAAAMAARSVMLHHTPADWPRDMFAKHL